MDFFFRVNRFYPVNSHVVYLKLLLTNFMKCNVMVFLQLVFELKFLIVFVSFGQMAKLLSKVTSSVP